MPAEYCAMGWRRLATRRRKKTWIVNATHTDVMVVYAQTEPDGQTGGIAAFIVDWVRAGFVRSPRLDTGAGRGIDAGAFQVHGYRTLAGELLQLKTPLVGL